jgi:hypothetical protein
MKKYIYSLTVLIFLTCNSFAQSNYPDNYDWGNINTGLHSYTFVSDAYDQQGGTCATYAVVSAAEMVYNKSFSLIKSFDEPAHDARIMFSCSYPVHFSNTDDITSTYGSTPYNVMKFVSEKGIALEKDFPSKWAAASLDNSNTEFQNYISSIPSMTRFTFSSFKYWQYDPSGISLSNALSMGTMLTTNQINYSIEDIKGLITTYGPVVAGVSSEYLRTELEEYKGKWPNDIICVAGYQTNSRDHAIVIIGWGKEYVSSLGKDVEYWKILNSWGKGWSNNGVGKVEINSLGISTGEISYFDGSPDIAFNYLDNKTVRSGEYVTSNTAYSDAAQVAPNNPVIVEVGGNCHVYNPSSITLKSGFQAKKGSLFVARIVPLYNNNYYNEFGATYNPQDRIKLFMGVNLDTKLLPEDNKDNKIESFQGFSIYPNPIINESLHINSDKTVHGKVTITINNILGQEVYSSSDNDFDSKTIDFTFFIKGLYVLKIEQNNNITCYKIIKQ